MELSEVLTITALSVTTAGLLLATYQTYLGRKSLNAAKTSIDLATRTRSIEILPKAGWVINVMVRLEIWRSNLESDVGQMKIALKNPELAVLKDVAAGGLKTPKGLVNKSTYEHAPSWLSVLLVTGAQYYFSVKVAMPLLWDEEKDEPHPLGIQYLMQDTQDCITQLNSLLGYIRDMVPEVYLRSPASLNDEDFLGA
jgi:hypothetical protein